MLLTATPGTGKTTAIKKIIDLIGKQNCGGFYSEEIKDDAEQRIGFECISLDGTSTRLADISFESEIKLSRYGLDIKAFEKIAINSIEESLAIKQVLIIDEIGPMQFFSEKFKEILNIVIDSEKIVVGSIFFNPHPDIDIIKKKEHVEIYELTKENRDLLPNEIVARVEAQIGE